MTRHREDEEILVEIILEPLELSVVEWK